MSLVLNFYAGHLAIAFAQRKHVDVEPELHTFAKGERRHAGDQRVAHRQAGTARVPQAIATEAQQQSAAVRERARGAAHIEKVLDINPVNHHPAKQQHSRWGRAEVAKMRTQFPSVKLHHLERPPDIDGAGLIRVIIRRERAQAIFHRALFFKKRQRLAP